MRPKTFDHVALWVQDPAAIAQFVSAHVGMHVIEGNERFHLVGSNARRGKLTLFAAGGERERGALKHVALRVSDLDAALTALPAGLPLERAGRSAYFDVREGLRLGLVEAPTDVEYDLDHAALFSASPEETARAYRAYGFRPADPGASGVPRVEVGGAFVELHQGDPGEPERPLLNHLAVLVDSAAEHRAEAERLEIGVADFVDGPNTLAVFLWGPERVRVEYVEHKPSFSLV